MKQKLHPETAAACLRRVRMNLFFHNTFFFYCVVLPSIPAELQLKINRKNTHFLLSYTKGATCGKAYVAYAAAQGS